MSQKGREILQRMQQQAAMLAKDLETERYAFLLLALST
jgi:hypothetical protein